METYTLKWKRFASLYDMYRSTDPGSAYSKVGTVAQESNPALPAYLHPSYSFDHDMQPVNVGALQYGNHIRLSWEEPASGMPYVFKVTEAGSANPLPDTLWLNDALPSGASWIDSTGISWDESRKISSLRSIRIIEQDLSIHPRIDISNPMPPGFIIVWAYLDPDHPPISFWLEFKDENLWEHRIYWGQNKCPFGKNGTSSRAYGGALPTCGCWTPLIFHTSSLELGAISGIGFGIEGDGSSVINIGAIAISHEQPYSAILPYHSPHSYNIYRDNLFIKNTTTLEFDDVSAVDYNGSPSNSYDVSFEQLESNEEWESVKISWRSSIGEGTTYGYKVSCVDSNGVESEAVSCSGVVNDNHSYVKLYYGDSKEHAGANFIGDVYEFTYTHVGLLADTTYWYKIESYNKSNQLTHTTIQSFTTKTSDLLDYFVLDFGLLA
jgi:hypothetical protein